MEPIKAYNLIRAACLRRPELAYKGWPKDGHRLRGIKLAPYTGCCYIASHAFSHLTGAEVWRNENGTHYWNKLNGELWDLTDEQFDQGFDHRVKSIKVPKKNKNKLPIRVKELLNECNK